MKRTFVAFPVLPAEEAFVEVLGILRNRLKHDRISWIDPAIFHITLAFLGDTPEEKIEGIKKALSDIAVACPPFTLPFRGIGVFGSRSDPRVLWAGTAHTDSAVTLQQEVSKALIRFGYVPEKRPFRPHLTLGRIKGLSINSPLPELLEKYRTFRLQEVLVKELFFYESILGKDGPVYTALGRYKLMGGSDSFLPQER